MALTDLGTLTVDALTDWQSFLPIEFKKTKAIYAIQCQIFSANPNQLFSQYIFRYQAALETGSFLVSGTIGTVYYDANQLFFPCTVYDKFDKDFPFIFQVKRIPYYRNLDCLASSTVNLQVDPDQALQGL